MSGGKCLGAEHCEVRVRSTERHACCEMVMETRFRYSIGNVFLMMTLSAIVSLLVRIGLRREDSGAVVLELMVGVPLMLGAVLWGGWDGGRGDWMMTRATMVEWTVRRGNRT